MTQEPKTIEDPFFVMTVPKDYVEKLGKEECI